MRILAAGTWAASFIAFTLVACGDEHASSSPGVSGGGYPVDVYCSSYTTCGSCTPVSGCGWCYEGDGTGTCAPSPNDCRTQSFEWTWNPSGCRASAEASIGPSVPSPVADGGMDSAGDAKGAVGAPEGDGDGG